MRRAFWALTLLGAVATCSSQDHNTKLMVAVWSDLAVPGKIDEIRIDVKGPTAEPSLDFLLASGKTKLPVLFALVPPDNQNLQFTVTATAYLQSTPIVSQTARLSFAPGKSRILKIVLSGACQGMTCPGMTCSSGNCQAIDVDVNSLSDYDPQAPLLPPDLGVGPGFDGGTGVEAGGGTEAGGVDGGSDGQETVDGAESKTADVPVSPGGADVGDGGGETDAAEANGTGGTGGIRASTGGAGGGGPGGLGGGPGGMTGGASGADAALDAPATLADGATTGGSSSGGAPGTGGIVATGGTSSGGGGAPSMGGAGTGGVGTGGIGTGGVGTGGIGTGGVGTGGIGTGGIGTGGSAACTAPFAECDLNPATVCETNTQSDATHCGSCPNRCTYPLCSAGVCATPTVYGRNTVPTDLTDSTIAVNLGANLLFGYRRVFPAASLVALGAVTSLSGLTSAGAFRVGLYTDNGGIPGTLVATTDTLTAANGIVEGILSAPVPLTAGSYWIMILIGNAGTVKLTKFNLPSPNTEVIKYATAIADWPTTATYVDATPNDFVPNIYAKAVAAP